MPVIKRQNAAPALKDAIVLDLGDVSRQAERIRRQAQEQAQRIIEQAEDRARELTEGAEATGRERAYAEGYQQGLTEGREKGRAEALEKRDQQLQQIESAWTQALEHWHQQRQQLESEARQGVIELALRIAEKLVHRVVEVDGTAVVDQLAAAMAHVLRPLDVHVRIHPKDRAILDEALPHLVADFHNVRHVELAEDATLDRGGCVLSFGQGEVDASLQTQFERIVHAMLPDHAREQVQAGESSPGSSHVAHLSEPPKVLDPREAPEPPEAPESPEAQDPAQVPESSQTPATDSEAPEAVEVSRKSEADEA